MIFGTGLVKLQGRLVSFKDLDVPERLLNEAYLLGQVLADVGDGLLPELFRQLGKG